MTDFELEAMPRSVGVLVEEHVSWVREGATVVLFFVLMLAMLICVPMVDASF